MKFHPVADMFTLIEGEDFAALVKDIRSNGLQESIKVMEGAILDGRNRFRACEEAGVEPYYQNVSPQDPAAYVMSANLHRRHLTPGQRAMVGARARKWYDEEAKRRQQQHASTAPGKRKTLPANLPEVNGDARDQIGKVVGVSGKYIDYATKVLNNATPEVVKAVDEGRMAVQTAAILSTEPEEVQKKEANDPKRRRDYKSCSAPQATDSHQEEEENEEIKAKGVGVIRASEAINCLIRIPKNDALRRRGLQLVTDWIRHNQ